MAVAAAAAAAVMVEKAEEVARCLVACSGAPLASSPGTRCRTPYNASILPYRH